MTQGQWFVNNLMHSEKIPCMDMLNEKLKNNDTSSLRSCSNLPSVYPARIPIVETKEQN
jgi:hypothetical protein